MRIPFDILVKIYGSKCLPKAQIYYSHLVNYMEEYHINTPKRIAAFIATIGHESGRLQYTEEIASGEAYEGRMDLGNIYRGDGIKYKGRGLIQLTGRRNYELLSKDYDIDFVSEPGLLSTPEYAVLSACWYWRRRKLNTLADDGNFREITRKVNGGYNGWPDRLEMYNTALQYLQI